MGWKKAVAGALGVGALGVGGLLGYGAARPKTWHVERNVIVQADPRDIAPLLDDLERWPQWAGGPDASGTTYTFGEKRKGAGATYTWRGPGTFGTVTLISSDEHGVTYEMTMEEGATPAHGTIRLKTDGVATKVTWTDEGDLSGLGPVGGLMAPAMQADLGAHVEDALRALGQLAERDAMDRKARAEMVDVTRPIGTEPPTPNAPAAPAAP